MFDPTCMIADTRWGYITCHMKADYHGKIPRRELWNPLRWQIGIGRRRPCWIVLNRKGKLYTRFSNLRWRLWRKRRWERAQAERSKP